VSGWISVAEAARRLGVDRHTLHDAIGRGEIEYRQVGRSVRVPAWLVDEQAPERTTPDVDELARAVAVELGRLIGQALARATVPDESRTVLDLLARDDKEGRHDRSA
jgi:excisionase family DNA binding protein